MKVSTLLSLLIPGILSADTITWDGGGDATSWTDPANWDGNALPTAGDDVIINIAANPTIQVANALTIRSLNSEEEIFFSGNLTLTGGTSSIKAAIFSNRSIFVSGGAVVTFPSLTTLHHPANRNVTLQADGPGSRLIFPNVTAIQGPNGNSDNFYFSALNGGRIELPLTTQVISGAVTFTATGTNSSIDLDALTTFNGKLNLSNSGFTALNGGSILTSSLTSITNGDLTCDTPGNLNLDLVSLKRR